MTRHASRTWYPQLLAALLLLSVEYLTISFVFDAPLRWMGLVGPAVIAFGTALWILGAKQVRAALSQGASTTRGAASLFRRLALHFACFAMFFALTARGFGGQEPPELLLSILLWVLGAAATILSLVPVAAYGIPLRPLARELAEPLAQSALLGLAAWGGGLATIRLWRPLRESTLNSVAAVLDVLISPIHFDPSEAAVGTERFWVRVAPVCSGYEGIGLTVVFLSAYLFVFSRPLSFSACARVVPRCSSRGLAAQRLADRSPHPNRPCWVSRHCAGRLSLEGGVAILLLCSAWRCLGQSPDKMVCQES